MRYLSRLRLVVFAVALMAVAALIACSNEERPTLVIGGIPDQDLMILDEMFGGIADYLEDELGFDVEYRPVTEYATLVTAFRNGDVKLAWFGGLTGVQARLATPGAEAIIQRPRDEEFTSVFIVGSGVQAESLSDLAGKSFTFGSISSTSGHLMPRSFLADAGVDPENDFAGVPSYSGSHDTTWKLVESGSFDAGALSSAVWERAVAEGQVDESRVRVLMYTEPYWDYHWVAHPEIDEVYGEGTLASTRDAFKSMSMDDAEQARVLELFLTDSFIDTNNDNYGAIESVARTLDLIE
ncbi:MAG: putative selenate ABC transporter substrate-binding protein [Dehalococcoidia bacterium]